MSDKPFFSIIIPTFNSEKTLRYTLESIINQTIDTTEYEILVVDGGSTDKTRIIADNFGAKVIDNPYRLPEHAKAIGTSQACGHYIIRMDSDEEFTYVDQLKDKRDFLINHPEIKVLVPNRYIYGRKEICGIAAEYINVFGDPFSYFVYRTKEDKCLTYKKNIVSEEESTYILDEGLVSGNRKDKGRYSKRYKIMRFCEKDVFPLADSGTTTLSLDFMRDKYPNEYANVDFICNAYDRLINDTHICGCIKGDDIKHNCSSSLKTYFSKLRFRVINNLFYQKESGFSSKINYNKRLKNRKLLFCCYALFIPVVFGDSIRLAIKYKRVDFLLHFIYVYYLCFAVAKVLFLKLLGKEVKNENYGKDEAFVGGDIGHD